MADFDPETFAEEKYGEYFTQLQQAYKNAFSRMNDEYDSTLIHAIDQQVLNESEPHYEGDGQFRIDLPEDPADRVTGVVVSDEKLRDVLDVYVDEIERELQRVFDLG